MGYLISDSHKNIKNPIPENKRIKLKWERRSRNPLINSERLIKIARRCLSGQREIDERS
jgi:hypothetical protein